MKKARILSESGPLRTELGGVRELPEFSAFLSRMHLVLRPIQPAVAGRGKQTLGVNVLAHAHGGKA